jgi:hypothetical protein
MHMYLSKYPSKTASGTPATHSRVPVADYACVHVAPTGFLNVNN